MPALDAFLQEKITRLQAESLYRNPKETLREEGVKVMRDGKTYISFACNDYLGLSHHPEVIEASEQALQNYGLGGGASRLITGEHPLYTSLETVLANYKGTQAACIFGSGYMANLGAITTIVEKGDLILADKYAHACMIDGAKLSGAKLLRFAHNDMDACRKMLQTHRKDYRHCLLLTETIFSMDGDKAPLAQLADLANEYDTWLMSDDAHGVGLSAPQGEDIIMGTLSKSLGSYGGYICGSSTLINTLKSSARSLMFTTSLPAAVLAGALTSLSVMRENKALCEAPIKKSQYFTELLSIPIAESQIVPLMLGDAEKTLLASSKLEEEGFMVPAIRPPTVPEGMSRLRFSFSACHEDSDIEHLASIIKKEGWV